MDEKTFKSMFVDGVREDIVACLGVGVVWDGRYLSFEYNDIEFAIEISFDNDQFIVVVDNRYWGFDSIEDAIDWIKTY